MDIKALAGQLLGNLKTSLSEDARKFVEENASVKAFLEERTVRAAELAVQYEGASDADRPAISTQMTVVQQTIVDETVIVLQNVRSSVVAEILAVAKSVFQFALQNLPTILSMIRK